MLVFPVAIRFVYGSLSLKTVVLLPVLVLKKSAVWRATFRACPFQKSVSESAEKNA